MSRTLDYGPSLHYGGTHGIRKNDGAVGGDRPGRCEWAVRHRRRRRPGRNAGDHRADGDGPGLVIVKDGQDDAQDKGGKRVIVRKIQGGDGPSFDIFGMGGSRVGMVVRDVEAADVTKEKLAGTAGAVVTEVVKESAAEKAGVKAGDVVTSFDGERVRSARQLERLVEETPAGRTVKVALQRAGAPVTLDVTPEAPKMAHVMPGMPGEGGRRVQL